MPIDQWGRTASARNPECAGNPPGGRRSHRPLGWTALGGATRTSVCRVARSARGNRTAAGWFVLAALPRPLPPPAALPAASAAHGKSFRPTASRTSRKSTVKNLQKCSSEPPMADISIWQKTGHFYFALTCRCKMRMSGLNKVANEPVGYRSIREGT